MTPRPLALPAALVLVLAPALGAPPPARAAAYLVLQVEDTPGEGFDDPSPVTPAGGNPATTLGEARLRALEFAAGLWAERLDSPVTIEIAVRFERLGGTPKLRDLAAFASQQGLRFELWLRTTTQQSGHFWTQSKKV